jgi:hypothetical protein
MNKVFFCSKRQCCPFLEYTEKGVHITDDLSNKVFLTKDNLKDLLTYLESNKKQILDNSIFKTKKGTS